MVVLDNDTVEYSATSLPNACAMACVMGGITFRYLHEHSAPLIGGLVEITGVPQSPTEGSFYARANVYSGCDPSCELVTELAEVSGQGTLTLTVPAYNLKGDERIGIWASPTTTVEIITVTAGWSMTMEGYLVFEGLA